MIDAAKVAVIVGASAGLGDALCQQFLARGWLVAALGRASAVQGLAAKLDGVLPVACDVTLTAELERAFSLVERELGPVSALIYNAQHLELGPSAATSSQSFERSWRVNCLGAFGAVQRVLPGMLERGAGTLIFSGASASRRGGRNSAAFSSSKFALRGMAQSLARELAPRGIHVAHVVIDGLIWSERTRARFQPQETACLTPDALAQTYMTLLDQQRSAWTHELDVRPWVENF